MSDVIRISKQRKTELNHELEFLRSVRTREAAAMVAEAMEYGDLMQNSEYEAAKKEQQNIRDRIAEIEKILSCCVVAEEKCLGEDFLAELKTRIQSCGLSGVQAESYADYCRSQYELQEQERYGILPADEFLQTLKEAQRIAAGRGDNFELNEYAVSRFLQVSCAQWQAAKRAMTECFGCSKETVDKLYGEDEEWLLLPADTVYALADCLNKAVSDRDIAWKIFRQGALLGEEAFKSRMDAVLNLLGEDLGKRVICADAEENVWLFYRFYSDPVGCIAYMKECGLTAGKILEVVQKDAYILHMYKEGRKRSYNHDQDQIDAVIRRYLN